MSYTSDLLLCDGGLMKLGQYFASQCYNVRKAMNKDNGTSLSGAKYQQRLNSHISPMDSNCNLLLL